MRDMDVQLLEDRKEEHIRETMIITLWQVHNCRVTEECLMGDTSCWKHREPCLSIQEKASSFQECY
ncbi:hypothetical protein N665_0418s0028 [Sinapis alba]|nr:hypothetical protein N665_0418s0028 [Sinapis alba]